MIIVSNPYRGVLEYNEQHADELVNEEVDALNVTLMQQATAFEEGAKAQLQACVRDLSIWTLHYQQQEKRKDDAALLSAFAEDWAKEHTGTGRFGPRTE